MLDAGARAGHWCLPGVRERARLIGAELNLWSRGATGTEIEIAVPASIAYLKYNVLVHFDSSEEGAASTDGGIES